ncbi:MAG: ABC transporter substrate-binding protein [Ruminococcaceae bacterium]|nr:ABC transporter substrate-binding protein [Oscillospiraceae bacterium]
MKAKKIISLVLVLALACLALVSCGNDKELSSVSVGVISGPTGVGAVSLMEKAANGETEGKYEFTLAANQEDAKAKFLNGQFDIVAMPTNLASVLSAKGEDIVVLAVNTYGVLYILDATGTVKTLADLAGKTITATGQGSNPEYILKHVLKENGITDVTVNFMDDASAISAGMVSGSIEIAMLPQPVATSTAIQAKAQGKTITPVIDMTAEWDKIADDSALMMGCMVTTQAFINENPDEVNMFLKEYKASIEAVLADVEAAAALCEKHSIIPKAAVAKQAIPKCNLAFVTGEEMKTNLAGYLSVLHAANPASVGGKLPADGFYYTGYEN